MWGAAFNSRHMRLLLYLIYSRSMRLFFTSTYNWMTPAINQQFFVIHIHTMYGISISKEYFEN